MVYINTYMQVLHSIYVGTCMVYIMHGKNNYSSLQDCNLPRQPFEKVQEQPRANAWIVQHPEGLPHVQCMHSANV